MMRREEVSARLETEWRDRLSRQATSSESIAAFCRSEGVTGGTFYGWRSRLSLKAVKAAPVKADEISKPLPFIKLGPTKDRCVGEQEHMNNLKPRLTAFLFVFLVSFVCIFFMGYAEAKEGAAERKAHHQRSLEILDQIKLVKSSVELLASKKQGNRFAIHYSLQFPQTGEYETFPAYLDEVSSPAGSISLAYGTYFRKIHPEYLERRFVFEPRTYDFAVIFDLGSSNFDPARTKANITICYGYTSERGSRTCRLITIKLADFQTAFTSQPSSLREPAVAKDNFWDQQEKSIRLDDLRIKHAQVKTGLPVEFSFAITNVGTSDIEIPQQSFYSLIRIIYGWEPISATAKKTKTNIQRLGAAVMAGGAQFTYIQDGKTVSIRQSKMHPGEKVLISDHIHLPGPPFDGPFKPGEYKLHIFLFNNYSTDQDPLQELIQVFEIVR